MYNNSFKNNLNMAKNLLNNNEPEKAKQLLVAALEYASTNQEKAELYELMGVISFLLTDMVSAAKSYFTASQNDTILRSQLEHFSSYLFCLHYLSDICPKDICKNIKFCNKLYSGVEQYDHSLWYKSIGGRPAGEKLKIGYLSADWREHAFWVHLAISIKLRMKCF